MREADGDQVRTVRQVHRLLGLPGMQDDQAPDARHRLSGAGLRGPARRAAHPARQDVLLVHGVSGVQVRPLDPPPQRTVPQLWGAVPHRTGSTRGQDHEELHSPGVRVQAGSGADGRGVRAPRSTADSRRPLPTGGAPASDVMDGAVSSFMEYLAVERGVSPHTLRNYAIDLREFTGFLPGEHASMAEAGARP